MSEVLPSGDCPEGLFEEVFEKLNIERSFWVRDALLSSEDEETKGKCSVLIDMLDRSSLCNIDQRLSIGDVQALHSTLMADNNCFERATHLLGENHVNGLAFLKLLQDKFLPSASIKESELKVLNMVFLDHQDRYLKDTEVGRYSFQLEPFNIIQLPWNPVRFHQWLMPTLNLVYGMEEEVLEFVHWPMPNKYFGMAQDFVFMAQTLKERLLLGLALLGAMVNQYPDVDPKIPSLILNDVVLPVLPMIQLFNAEGIAYLRSFKRIVWPQETSDEQLVSPIPKGAALEVESELEKLHQDNIYNYQFWLALSKKKHIFGNVKNYGDIASRLKSKKTPDVVESSVYIPDKADLTYSLDEFGPMASAFLQRILFQKGMLFAPGKTPRQAVRILDSVVSNPLIYQEAKELVEMQNVIFNQNLRLYSLRIPEVVMHFSFKLHFQSRLLVLARRLCDASKGKLKLAAHTVPGPVVELSAIQGMLTKYKKFAYCQHSLISLLDQGRPSTSDEKMAEFWEPFDMLEVKTHEILGIIFRKSYRWMEKQQAAFPEWQFLQYFVPSLIASMAADIQAGGPHLNVSMVKIFLKKVVMRCRELSDAYLSAPNSFATSHALPAHKTKFELASALTLRNESLHLELTSIFHWLFLGKKNANIFNVEELEIIANFDWFRNKEMSSANKSSRMCNLQEIHEILTNDPGCDSLLLPLCLAGLECKSRMSLLLFAARSCFKLPESGAEIPNCPKLSNLHQVLAIFSEISLLIQLKKECGYKVELPDNVNVAYAQARFLQLWNKRVNNLEITSSTFEVNPKHDEMHKVSLAYKGQCVDAVFTNMSKELIAKRKGLKNFDIPPAYATPNGMSKTVKKAVKRFALGDLETYKQIVGKMLGK